MRTAFKFAPLLLVGLLMASCATPPATTATRPVRKVRTTAYTHFEGGSGRNNAIGKRLVTGKVSSAASDWSRFPLGTRFRILRTGQEYVIDDYGGALVGTDTIDLYAPSHATMRRWGVRHEDIEILEWGSSDESLRILQPRSRVARVRRMIADLEKQKAQPAVRRTL